MSRTYIQSINQAEGRSTVPLGDRDDVEYSCATRGLVFSPYVLLLIWFGLGQEDHGRQGSG